MGLRGRLTVSLAIFIVLIMGLAIEFARRQQSEILDREVRERGKALARAVAANSIEPLALETEATLLIMQLVQGVIQISPDPAARRRLFRSESLGALVWRSLVNLGREHKHARVQNEGVIFAKVVGPDGKVIAAADVILSQERSLNELGSEYQPAFGTGTLKPGDSEEVWESSARGGIFVIGVPILAEGATRVAAGVATGVATGVAAGVATGVATPASGERYAPARLGTVYLGMSKAIIRQAIALAIAKLLMVAAIALAVGIVTSIIIVTRLVRPLRLLGDAVTAVGAGDYRQRVAIRRKDELGELGAAFNDMAQGLEEREIIRSAFVSYVSHDLLANILNNPEAMNIGGAKRNVTMVDSDIRGFTSLSASLPPEEVVSVINAYLDVQTRIIAEHGGHIDRFVGDEILAVFGVPEEDPDDAERAVRCAWALREAVALMIEEREGKGLPAPRIGIGVDTGTVVAGNMGAQGVKIEYAVVGDPLGTAHELVDMARDPNVPGGQVIISEDTYRRVKDIAIARELEALALPGSRSEVKTYELTGVKPPYLLVIEIPKDEG